jgi:hypothetical protein
MLKAIAQAFWKGSAEPKTQKYAELGMTIYEGKCAHTIICTFHLFAFTNSMHSTFFDSTISKYAIHESLRLQYLGTYNNCPSGQRGKNL